MFIVDISINLNIIVDMSIVGGLIMDRIGKVINQLAILNRNDSNQRLKQYNLTGSEGAVLLMFNEKPELYQEDIIKKLEIDKLYFEVKNQFDVLYKNMKIERNSKITLVLVGVLVVTLVFNILNYFKLF